jgi:hypothetical protein
MLVVWIYTHQYRVKLDTFTFCVYFTMFLPLPHLNYIHIIDMQLYHPYWSNVTCTSQTSKLIATHDKHELTLDKHYDLVYSKRLFSLLMQIFKKKSWPPW